MAAASRQLDYEDSFVYLCRIIWNDAVFTCSRSFLDVYSAMAQDHKVTAVGAVPLNSVQLISKSVHFLSGITIQ